MNNINIGKYKKYLELLEEIKKCEVRSEKSKRRILLGRGDINPDFMFIAHAPMDDYNRKGVVLGPYSNGGIKFNRILETIAPHQDKSFTYWVTNLVKSPYPANKDKEKIRKDYKKLLKMEINILKPEVLILFGRYVIDTTIGLEKINNKIPHGDDSKKWSIENHEYPCIQSIHPTSMNLGHIIDLSKEIRKYLK